MTGVPEDRSDGAPFTEEHRSVLESDGYVILPGLLSEAECDRLSALLDAAWEDDRHNLPPHPDGEEPGVQFIRNPLRHTAELERCITHPAVLDAARSMIGPGIILHIINARSVEPGYGAQPLHELRRRRGRPFRVCNVIWCLDAFTPDTGSTRVLPATHLDDTTALERMGDPMEPHPDQVTVIAPRGSVLIFNSALIHAGSRNTTDRPRRSVQCNFAHDSMSSWYPWAEQVPAGILGSLSPTARALMGLLARTA